MSAWDPAQYLKFADQRRRPAIDLLGRIDLAHPAAISDLGAGAGNVTRLIKDRWPAARVTGVDASREMLAKAAGALHWLPDHAGLFPRLLAASWRATLEPLLRPAPVAEPAFYYDALAPHAAALDIWETEYLQVLEGEHPVLEWTKGTWPERGAFEAAYATLVDRAYPRRADGRTLFPFRRLFIIARR